MEQGTLLDPVEMRREIDASHERSRHYNINQEERNPDQVRLTPAQLEERRQQNKDFLDVAAAHIDEFYDLISPHEFMIGVAGNEGYYLSLYGSDEIKAKFAERNCAPGYRWTEWDVGTTATSCVSKDVFRFS